MKFEIGICSACWGGYHKYVENWARSIASQTYKPKQIHLVIEESHPSREAVKKAKEILPNLEVTYCLFKTPAQMRNDAVRPLHTEWVQFVDIDDELLPRCLESCSKVEGADVIQVGFKRRINGKIERKTRSYSPIRGISALKAPVICPSLSPFKKELWEAAPYRDFANNKGGWDYALWIGFILRNARFKPAPEAGFIYNIHEDSVFQQRVRKKGSDKDTEVGRMLMHFRWGVEWPVSFLIPYQESDQWRSKAKDAVIRMILNNFPSAEVLVSDEQEGKFCKPKLVNDLFKKSRNAMICVLDADCLPSHQALKQAFELAKQGTWVVPHTEVHRLSAKATELYYKTGEIKSTDLARSPYEGIAGGGCFVMNRWQYEKVGGMDERFTGWGGEDLAFGYAADAILGKHIRLAPPLVHLWHPPQETKHGAYGNNNNLGQEYLAAHNSKYAMSIIAERNRLALLGEGHDIGEYCYLCTNLDMYYRRRDLDPTLPKLLEIQKSVTGNRRGKIKTCAPPKIMCSLPIVSQISESEYHKL